MGTAIAAGWLAWMLAPLVVPLPDSLQSPGGATATITDRTGAPLRRPLGPMGDRRRPLAQDGPGDQLVKAIVAAEDHRFFHHHGVDYLALARAVRDRFSGSHAPTGGSTITQQLVKLAANEDAGRRLPRTVGRKVREILAARRLEGTWDKQRILLAYLDRLPYGNLHTGCVQAADAYFGKSTRSLSAAEAALLAAIPNAPTRLNPYRHPEACLVRRREVLERMVAEGFLTAAEGARAAEEPLRLLEPGSAFRAPHMVDLLAGLDRIPDTGTIVTSIDPDLQATCESLVADHVRRLAGHDASSAAVVVIDNASGEVLSLVGSPDYRGREGGQINGAWTPRSPGSALKPFTYLLAFEQGATPGTILPDVPVAFPSATGSYRPVNYDRRFHGPVTCRGALACSLNVVAVRLLADSGGPGPLRERLATLGLTTLTEPADHYGLGLTLGSADVRLLELTAAYATIARLGDHLPWRLVLGPDRPAATRVADPIAAWLVADILADPDARAPAFGEAPSLRFPFRVAAKTGTSTDFRDNWTLGFTPEFTVGVWVGNPDRRPMRDVTGLSGAAPLFHDVVLAAAVIRPPSWFPVPPGLARVPIDPFNGRAPGRELAARLRAPVRDEIFPQHRTPEAATPGDYDSEGRTVLHDRTFLPWFHSPDNHLASFVALPAHPTEREPPVVVSPLDGDSVLLDPARPGEGRRLLLEALDTDGPAAGIEWSSPTLEIERQPGAPPMARLHPGTHAITARDPATGLATTVRIEVRSLD